MHVSSVFSRSITAAPSLFAFLNETSEWSGVIFGFRPCLYVRTVSQSVQ